MSDFKSNRGPRPGGSRPPRGGEQRRGGADRGRGFRPKGPHGRHEPQDTARVDQLLRQAEQTLADSINAVSFENLSAFERKHVHEFFEHNLSFETKTYRDGEKYVLWVFPVGNLKKYAEEKANEAVATGSVVALPPMSSYERFIVHETLKDWDSVETTSEGEGTGRHVLISPVKFGRRLKKIAKKIKLF